MFFMPCAGLLESPDTVHTSWLTEMPFWDAKLGVGPSNTTPKLMVLNTKQYSLCGDEEELTLTEMLSMLKTLTVIRF